MVVCLLFLLLLWLSEPLGAEEEPLVTDRPDIAESSLTVGPGVVQVETGYSFERGKDGSEVHVTPTLLRLGTGPNTEVRLEGEGLTRRTLPVLLDDGSAASQRQQGLADVSLGIKTNLLEGDPSIGVLFTLDLPVGSQPFRANAVTPAAKVLADFDLGEGWSLGFNAGVLAPREEGGERFVQGLFAASLGYPLSDPIRGYLELSGIGPDFPGGPFLMALDGGFTYLVNPDLQLDVSALRGLSGSGLDWSLGAGLSARF